MKITNLRPRWTRICWTFLTVPILFGISSHAVAGGGGGGGGLGTSSAGISSGSGAVSVGGVGSGMKTSTLQVMTPAQVQEHQQFVATSLRVAKIAIEVGAVTSIALSAPVSTPAIVATYVITAPVTLSLAVDLVSLTIDVYEGR